MTFSEAIMLTKLTEEPLRCCWFRESWIFSHFSAKAQETVSRLSLGPEIKSEKGIQHKEKHITLVIFFPSKYKIGIPLKQRDSFSCNTKHVKYIVKKEKGEELPKKEESSVLPFWPALTGFNNTLTGCIISLKDYITENKHDMA